MEARPLDTRAWLIWIAGTSVPALLTLNPWYQLILIAIVVMIWTGQPVTSENGFLRSGLLLRIALISLIFSAAFNMLVIHYGYTILVHLPESLPIIGGIITLEALIYGLLNALRLISILFAFALFSRSINYADLMRLAPSALFELGLMLSIGFTLVPFTIRSFNEIREAQALRGHRSRGVRDLIPLFTPLVISGMEHALALAESMEARGYGGVTLTRRVWMGQGLAVISLIGLLIVLAIQVFAPLRAPVLILLLIGVGGLMVMALRQLSAASGRTRLRHGHWGSAETMVAVGAMIPVVVLILSDHWLLAYDPYHLSSAGWPPFNPWIGLALLGLALPGLVIPQARNRD